jgi:hypothetical protein
MSLDEEFLKILSVLLAPRSSVEPSLPEAGAPEAVSPDAAAPASRLEDKKRRSFRS